MKNKTPNEYIRLGGVLLLITSVVALLLGFFNSITVDVIASTAEKNKIAAMQSIMPAASSFEPLECEIPEGSSIAEVYGAYDSAGTSVGYCFTLTPKGYGGQLTIMAGIDTALSVTGVDIVSHSETPGLGANADDAKWLSQFVGKTEGLTVVKTVPQNNQIQAVTSATITSKAVTGAVDSALVFAKDLIEKEAK